MLQDIRLAKSFAVDGVVFGCLHSDGTIDEDATGRLWRLAKELVRFVHEGEG
jgi:copper homeostasis protein CutC